jgi:hypothetical protein
MAGRFDAGRLKSLRHRTAALAGLGFDDSQEPLQFARQEMSAPMIGSECASRI